MKDRNQLYQAFEQAFPLEQLNELTLEKYTNLNKNDSFCYWVESRTKELGSFWGGSSYKFGIYAYRNKPATGDYRVQSDDRYAWYSKYNKGTAEATFQVIKQAIIRIAHLANKGQFDAIDSIDELGDGFKWKIAFLYSHEQLIPIYKMEMLQQLAQHFQMAPQSSRMEIQRKLMEIKGDKDLYDFYDELLIILAEQKEQAKAKAKRIWLFSPGVNACIWDKCLNENAIRIKWGAVGNLMNFDEKANIASLLKSIEDDTETNHANITKALWQFSHEMKEGDLIYAKSGTNTLLGKGIVESEYTFEDELTDYPHSRRVKWLQTGSWKCKQVFPTKTLTEFTLYKNEIQEMEGLLNGSIPTLSDDAEKAIPAYTEEDFISEVFMNRSDFHHLKALILQKKNVILQGAPGVGKTFTAERLAFACMGLKDKERIEKIQFHQNYSYEDFIMGYKPTKEGGFELRYGVFYQFCQKAKENPDKDFFFIIDEINRGNLSKIFGELLMLIEKGYRDTDIQLAYTGEHFAVPSNLYLLGMMNTADRSLAMIDYALRRRFSFFEMKPGFETEGFKKYQQTLVHDEKFDRTIEAIIQLNRVIEKDESLKSGFCIGHSYFCGYDANQPYWLQNVIAYDIKPMLKEYWFDNEQKYKEQMANLDQIWDEKQ